ncbi:TPA: hypothetical protein ACPETS_002518 [Enterobacter hormaechei]|uniref:hypothetical protein n=1 Tax=Enterobacter hormaechei TaxID=158836 RepID=UPI0007926C71|nr:hypothetical protein [Enterobacter hormaechei]CAE6352080.1 hypothetical protein AI2716V1_2130 [Enterobacter cloacae]CAH3477476.1 hypothetical protein AI2716V1_2130 [Enterobacter cloacae]CZV75112.1 Uncharacterised protein [Enterobacter hormaechei]
MITLTKEWLLKTITELEEERDAVPGVVNEDAAMALAAMKLAMASLEAEPVCVIDQSNLDYLNSGSDADVWPASRKEMGDVLLYRTAPPAPVSVPDAIHSQGEKSASDDYYALGWNACRAAMLQSFGNSEQLNSPVIQDGSEDTKRLDWLDAQNKRLNEYYWTTYGWKFDANFQRNAMMLNDSNYPVMTVRQAIDEAIAAAPQQEVTAKPKK